MPRLRTQSGIIDFTEWGTGGGERLVMLHASATGPRSLARLAVQLPATDRQITAPAFAGYDGTRLDREGASRMTDNIALVRELIANRPTDRLILFGHSMGGLIALLTALDLAQRGTPADTIILYEPVLIGLLDLQRADHAAAHQWDRNIIDKLGEHVAAGDPEAGVRHFIEAWNETNWSDLPEPAWQHLIRHADNLVRETAAVSIQQLERSRLATLETPVLLLRGDRSPPVTALICQATADTLPNAEQSILPDCGHMAPLLRPDLVAAKVREFLIRCQPGDT